MTPTFRVCVYEMIPQVVPATGEQQEYPQRLVALYEQHVPVLDLNRVIAAVNHKPRAPRKPRTPKP